MTRWLYGWMECLVRQRLTLRHSPLCAQQIHDMNPARLLYLHEGACVDAVVENWAEEKLDVKEGSRQGCGRLQLR